MIEDRHDFRVDWSKPNLHHIELLAESFVDRCNKCGMDVFNTNFLRKWIGLTYLAKLEEYIRDSEAEWYKRGLNDAREEIDKPYLRRR